MKIKRLLKVFFIRNPTKANYKFMLKDWVRLPDLEGLTKVLETKRFSVNLDPVEMKSPQARSILCIAPHPDDDVLSSGGTLLHAIKNGIRVKVVYITSAANPTFADASKTILTRQAQEIEEETKQVAREMGSEIEFWRYDKRSIPVDGIILEQLRNAIVLWNPEILFLPFLTDDHPDHRLCNKLLYRALHGVHCTVKEIWAYQVYSTVLPNVVVDISDVMEEKVRIIGLWKSQKRSRDWAHYISGLNAFNSRFLKTNQPRYAETFFVVPLQEYLELCRRYYEP